MKRKKISIFIVIAVCLVTVLVGVSALSYFNKEDKLTYEAKLLTGTDLSIGELEKNNFQENQKAINYQNKLWVIYLLSTCEACKDELRFAEQLAENSSSVEVVGVMSEEEAVIKKFVKTHNIKFPILLDRDRKLAKSIKLKYFPSNFIVNNGKIEKVIFGSPQDKAKLSEFIK